MSVVASIGVVAAAAAGTCVSFTGTPTTRAIFLRLSHCKGRWRNSRFCSSEKHLQISEAALSLWQIWLHASMVVKLCANNGIFPELYIERGLSTSVKHKQCVYCSVRSMYCCKEITFTRSLAVPIQICYSTKLGQPHLSLLCKFNRCCCLCCFCCRCCWRWNREAVVEGSGGRQWWQAKRETSLISRVLPSLLLQTRHYDPQDASHPHRLLLFTPLPASLIQW